MMVVASRPLLSLILQLDSALRQKVSSPQARREKPPLLFYDYGFTLMEVLVVLALFGLLAAIAIPTWIILLPTYALNSAARQIQSELNRIKMQAVGENATFRLVFSDAADNYTVERDAGTTTQQGTKPLPEQIDVLNSITLGFTSRGTATPGTGGTVRLCNSKGAGTNVVISSTGRVRVCKTSACNGTC